MQGTWCLACSSSLAGARLLITGQVMVSVPTPGNPGDSGADIYEAGRLTVSFTGQGILQVS